MTTRVEVPGYPGDYVRIITALEMVELHEAGDTNGMRGSILFAHLCTVDADGNRRFATVEEAGAAAWLRIKACAEKGFEVNGLIESDRPGN